MYFRVRRSGGKGSGVCRKVFLGDSATLLSQTDDQQNLLRYGKRRAFSVGTDTSTLVEICHQHGTQGLKKNKQKKQTTKNNISQTCTIYASGFVVDTSSTIPPLLLLLFFFFERELQHNNYTDLTGRLNVTTAVALANTQRPPARHVSSIIPFSSVTHCSYI